jgi:hypothetical protein
LNNIRSYFLAWILHYKKGMRNLIFILGLVSSLLSSAFPQIDSSGLPSAQSVSTGKFCKANPQQTISFPKQMGYGMLWGTGIGAVTALGVAAIAFQQCHGMDCMSALGLTILAGEAGFIVGNTIGVVLGADGQLNNGGKVLAFLGSVTGAATSVLLSWAASEQTDISVTLVFVTSNLVLSPVLSAIFSRGGIKNNSQTALYNFTDHAVNFPDIAVGFGNSSITGNFEPGLNLKARLISF